MKARILLVMTAALAGGGNQRAETTVAGLTSSVVESSPAQTAAQSEGSGWRVHAPIPEPLGVAQGATVSSADGSLIYHIGGITGDMTASNRVWVYSTADDTWSKAADIPVEPGIRTFGAAVELDGFIYVFGGFDGENILDTTWIYDETKDAWFQGASMPAPGFGPAVVVDGDIIWVALGFQGLSRGSEATTVWRYEPQTNRWSLQDYASPLGRCRGVLFPNGDLHFLAGAFDGVEHIGKNFRQHYSFTRPQIPVGVTDPAVVKWGGRIYVAGGGGPAPRRVGRTQIYDEASQTWFSGPMLPSPIDNTSGAIANNVFYIVGGFDGATPVSINYALALSADSERESSPVERSTANDFSVAVDQYTDGDGGGWSINWRVPEVFGVAQGSTLASNDGSVIYHIGGWVASGVYVSNRLRVYSPAVDIGDAAAMRSPWWDAANVPVSRGIRSYGSAVELNGFIYLFGGVSGEVPSIEILKTTWIYDETNDEWSRGRDMPDFRFGSAVATDGNVIWVIGGYNFGPERNVWRYDPVADTYQTGFANIPINLGRIHGVWLPDGSIHVFGGFEPPRINHHLVYDTLANAWSEAPDIPVGVIDPATVTDGSFIYLAGAQDSPFPRPPGYVHVFDPASGTWYQGPQMPGPYGVDNTSGTVAKGIFYVMGGSWGGGSTMSMNYSIPLSKVAPSIAGRPAAFVH